MARTRPARAFEILARDHDAAETLGITPAELRERRADMPLTRRDLLRRGAAAAGAGSPSGRRCSRALPEPRAGAARVAIVGAGIAGLNTALTLQDKGVARRSTRRPITSAAGCTPSAAATGRTAR